MPTFLAIILAVVILGGIVLGPIAALYLAIRMRRPNGFSACAICGYDRDQVHPSLPCPECGIAHKFTKHAAPDPPRLFSYWPVLAILIWQSAVAVLAVVVFDSESIAGVLCSLFLPVIAGLVAWMYFTHQRPEYGRICANCVAGGSISFFLIGFVVGLDSVQDGPALLLWVFGIAAFTVNGAGWGLTIAAPFILAKACAARRRVEPHT